MCVCVKIDVFLLFLIPYLAVGDGECGLYGDGLEKRQTQFHTLFSCTRTHTYSLVQYTHIHTLYVQEITECVCVCVCVCV